MGNGPRAVALILAVVGSTLSNAQSLTETQFVENSLANHPSITAAEAGFAAASGASRQASVFRNPVISWEREDPDAAARQDTLRVSWRLPFDGRKHRVAEADASVAASAATLEAVRFTVRLEMRELFSSWYIAAEREYILKDHLDHTRRLAAWMWARAEQGEAAGVEARRLELEVEVLSRQNTAANAEARGRHAAAKTWSNLVAGNTQPERPLLPPPPLSAEISERPDLQALEQRVAAAEARHRLRKRTIEPPLVSLGWMELSDSIQSVDGPVFGVAWPVPLFDRNQGDREAAAAEADMSRADLEAARRRAVQHAEAALASYSELYRAVATGAAGTAADDIVDSVLAAFEAGEASLTDVLDSLRTTIDVRLARLETLAAALAAERDLEAAVGHLILPGGNS